MGSHDLPDEIIEEILVKLPMKAMIGCKCINKWWFDLIKSSNRLIESEVSPLALCFTNYSGDQESFFLYIFIYDLDDNDDEKKEETSAARARRLNKGIKRWHKVFDQSWFHNSRIYSHLPQPLLNYKFPAKLSLIGNCNGILCLSNGRFIVLANPLLKEVKTLPDPEFYNDVSNGYRQCRLIGFGFDNTTMDFKVVVVSHPIKKMIGYDGEQRVDVYNLRSNSWRKLGAFPFVNVSQTKEFTFLNGVIYWCVRIIYLSWRILTFNMATESFEQLNLPKGWYDGRPDKLPTLLVWNKESLALVPYYPDRDKSCSKPSVIWKMNKNGYEVTWTKLYSLAPSNNIRSPISFPKKHKFAYETIPGKLILYDLLDHSHSVVSVSLRGHTPSLDVGVFWPSRISINM